MTSEIRAAFIPSLDALQARYDAQATAAKEHEPSLNALKNELSMFPVEGGTLYEWATHFIAEGKSIDTLLSQRADSKDRKAASALRGEVVSKLNRLRADLNDAAKDDSNLPADLEDQVFAYFDLLEGKDAEAAAEERKKLVTKKDAPPNAPQGSWAPPSPGAPPTG